MRALFSVRHEQALQQRTMTVSSLSMPLRHRLQAIVSDFNEEVWIPTNGWDNRSYVLSLAFDYMLNCLGTDNVRVVVDKSLNKWSPADDIIAVLVHGRPIHVLDAIEAIYDNVYSARRSEYQETINQVFRISRIGLRFTEGEVFLLDKVQLTEEIISPALVALKTAGCMGAVEEFGDAVKALHNGETKRAVEQANKALESTMKHITGIPKAKPGALLRALVQSGTVPEYASGFIDAFEKLTATVTNIRNDAPGAGHGQGTAVTDVPPAVAQLMVNLCGSVILFLIERHIESTVVDG